MTKISFFLLEKLNSMINFPNTVQLHLTVNFAKIKTMVCKLTYQHFIAAIYMHVNSTIYYKFLADFLPRTVTRGNS